MEGDVVIGANGRALAKIGHKRPNIVARPVGRPRGSRDMFGRAFVVVDEHVDALARRFAEHLRTVREDANVSVAELAAAMGYSAMTLHAYERGAVVPSLMALIRMALALRVPLDHLIPT